MANQSEKDAYALTFDESDSNEEKLLVIGFFRAAAISDAKRFPKGDKYHPYGGRDINEIFLSRIVEHGVHNEFINNQKMHL